MSSKKWSEIETEYLEEKWGKVSLKSLSNRLGRTEASITLKAYRIGLRGRTLSDDFISLRQLIISLGCGSSYRWYKEKFINNGLKTFKKEGVLKVKIYDFWKWAEQNKSLINFAKFEENLLGVEPNWVKEKRKLDLLNPTKTNHNRQWTTYEDNLLVQKLKLGRYTYEDLSKEFNRTEEAIKRRIKDINTLYRPVPRERNYWTVDEINKLKELYNNGVDSFTISKILNKPQNTIVSKVTKLKKNHL